MGQFIDEDQDDRRRIVARLIGQPGWEESQPMIYTTGPAPLGVESAMSSNGYQDATRPWHLSTEGSGAAPADPCPQCRRGGTCSLVSCGRKRSSELMAMYGSPSKRPYIPAGCDQQGRVKDGARADICSATDKALSDWATLPADLTSKSVEPIARIFSAAVLMLLGWGVYAIGRALGAWG